MDKQQEKQLGSNKQFRVILVIILTMTLVVTMIPLSANESKVDAATDPSTYTSINQLQTTYNGQGKFTGGSALTECAIGYKIKLDYHSPVRVYVRAVSLTSSPGKTGTFDIIFKNETETFYSIDKEDNTGAKDFKTKILNPGTYTLILRTDEKNKAWNSDFKIDVYMKENIVGKIYTDRGFTVLPYTGKPVSFVKNVRLGGTSSSPLLIRDRDYWIHYSKGNVNIGTGVLTVKGKNGFYGSVNSYKQTLFTYTIKPNKVTIYKKKTTISSTRPAKRQLKIKWKKISTANYYQIKYRAKGTKKWYSKTVSGSKTSLTIKKLKKGKRYQYKVRGLQKLKGYTAYYSKYSTAKTSSKIK